MGTNHLTPTDRKLFKLIYDKNAKQKLEEIKQLFRKADKPNPNAINDKDGWTPFENTVANNHYEIAKFLITQGANVNRRQMNNATSMYFASEFGHLDMLKLLINCGGKYNFQRTNDSTSPLMMAAWEGHSSVVQYLLTLPNINLNYRTQADDEDCPNATALQLAQYQFQQTNESKFQKIAKMIQQTEQKQKLKPIASPEDHVSALTTPTAHGTDNSFNDATPFFKATDFKHPDGLKMAGANPNLLMNDESDPLHVACERGHLKVVQKLLKVSGVNLHKRTFPGAESYGNTTPLEIARKNNHSVIARLLEQAISKENLFYDELMEVEPNYFSGKKISDNEQALLTATKNNKFKDVKNLFAAFSDLDVNVVDATGRSPLHYAIAKGSLKMTKLLIAKGADTQLLFVEEDAKALHLAVSAGHLKIVKFLIEQANVAVEQTNIGGQTPLMIAARKGRLKILNYLLKMKADIDATDIHGYSAFISAMYHQQIDVLNQLVNMGANIELLTENNENAMSFALEETYITGLLELGLTTSLRHKDNSTPLHYACEGSTLSGVKALIEGGAAQDVHVISATDNCTPIMRAAAKEHFNIVEYLLQAFSHLDLSVKSSDNVSDSDFPKNATVSEIAKIKNCDAQLLTLLQTTAARQLKDTQRTTLTSQEQLLISAVAQDNITEARNLFKKHPDLNPNIFNPADFSPLHIAAMQGNHQLVILLMQQGAHTTLLNKNHETALYLAAKYGHDKIVYTLLENKTLVNQTKPNGSTPLFAAAWAGHINSVMQLLHVPGINLHQRTAPGPEEYANATPLEIARRKGHSTLITLLEQAIKKEQLPNAELMKLEPTYGAFVPPAASAPPIGAKKPPKPLPKPKRKTEESEIKEGKHDSEGQSSGSDSDASPKGSPDNQRHLSYNSLYSDSNYTPSIFSSHQDELESISKLPLEMQKKYYEAKNELSKTMEQRKKACIELEELKTSEQQLTSEYAALRTNHNQMLAAQRETKAKNIVEQFRNITVTMT